MVEEFIDRISYWSNLNPIRLFITTQYAITILTDKGMIGYLDRSTMWDVI